jgi:hypothetical protein
VLDVEEMLRAELRALCQLLQGEFLGVTRRPDPLPTRKKTRKASVL